MFVFLDRITLVKAFAFGAAVTVMNVKNLAIFLSVVSVLLLSGLSLSAKIAWVLPIVLLFSSSVIVPVFIYVMFPNHAHERLHWLKQTLERYSRSLGLAFSFILGVLLLVRGVMQLW